MPEDQIFLRSVFKSTRADVLFSNLPAEQQEEFLDFQFRAQDTHYRRVFPNADFSVVLVGNTRIGRLYVDRRADELRILDIALLPQFRSQGYGTKLLCEILNEAGRTDRPVRIHVDLASRQVQFYKRLEFVTTRIVPPHQLMEWRADRGIVHNA